MTRTRTLRVPLERGVFDFFRFLEHRSLFRIKRTLHRPSPTFKIYCTLYSDYFIKRHVTPPTSASPPIDDVHDTK